MENIIFLVTLFSMTGLIVDGRTDLYWLGSAWPHVAGVCKQFLKDKGTETANCPSHSPGWNPVKQLWDIMFWSIRCYLRLPSSLVIWSRYGRRSPEDTIHGLARSIPWRCHVCISWAFTYIWIQFWVATMKIQHNGLACCIIFSLIFLLSLNSAIYGLIMIIFIKWCGILMISLCVWKCFFKFLSSVFHSTRLYPFKLHPAGVEGL